MPELIIHPDRPSEYLHGAVIAVDNRRTPTAYVTIDLRYVVGDEVSQENLANRPLTFDQKDEADMAIYNGLKAKVLAVLEAYQAELQAAKDARLARAELKEVETQE